MLLFVSVGSFVAQKQQGNVVSPHVPKQAPHPPGDSLPADLHVTDTCSSRIISAEEKESLH